MMKSDPASFGQYSAPYDWKKLTKMKPEALVDQFMVAALALGGKEPEDREALVQKADTLIKGLKTFLPEAETTKKQKGAAKKDISRAIVEIVKSGYGKILNQSRYVDIPKKLLGELSRENGDFLIIPTRIYHVGKGVAPIGKDFG